MDESWKRSFTNRMRKFESFMPASGDHIPVSIKLRITSGCFHREHSPHAYSTIDQCLRSLHHPQNSNFRFEEHESGPEILVYMAVTAAGLNLAKSVIDLIVTIIKARSEGAKKGDRADSPIELIVRRTQKDGDITEEKVLHIGRRQNIDSSLIEAKLKEAASKLIKNPVKSKKLTKASTRPQKRGGR